MNSATLKAPTVPNKQTYVLRPQPLTPAAFAEFGDVIDSANHTPIAINDGTTARYHALAQVQLDNAGHGLINFFDSQPTPLPLPLCTMERHPLGSQAFIPLAKRRFIIVVAHGGDTVHADQLQAFITNGQQGINYHRNVWHHAVIALDEMTRFVVVDRGGPGENCEFTAILGEAVLELA